MAVRVPRKRSETTRTARYLAQTPVEVFGYVLIAAMCVAIGWALATLG